MGNVKKVQLLCVAAAAALVMVSCGGATTSTDTQASDATGQTIPTFDLTGNEDSPEDEAPAETDETAAPDTDSADAAPAKAPDANGNGGVVPKVNGNARPAAPQKETPPKPTKPAETTPPTAAPKPVPAKPNPAIPNGGDASSIERRIASLTNQLRTNPNGPLKRTGYVPHCDGAVKIDSATGQPTPRSALKFNDTVSVHMARPWSAQMSPNNFQHRPDQKAVLDRLGVAPQTWGENIAWHAPPKEDPAMYHFVQWRQSDSHFCNMMSTLYTHIGVGEHQHNGGSYATQNFYATY